MSKLNVLLAKTDSLASSYKNMLKNYCKFFKNSQGAFQGRKETYEPKDNTVDDPKKRSNSLVQTTVHEKLDWLRDNAKEYVDGLFSLEKTNASGNAKAELIVEDESWGEFTSLELLRLKNLLENGDFKQMNESIPVRSDSKAWTPTQEEMYVDRSIYETPKVVYENKTTEKESYILPDPNVTENSKNYTPQVAVKTTVVVLGEGTHQDFSGEFSQRQKATVLKKTNKLHVAVIEALKRANECEQVESELKSDKIFEYLYN